MNGSICSLMKLKSIYKHLMDIKGANALRETKSEAFTAFCLLETGAFTSIRLVRVYMGQAESQLATNNRKQGQSLFRGFLFTISHFIISRLC